MSFNIILWSTYCVRGTVWGDKTLSSFANESKRLLWASLATWSHSDVSSKARSRLT